LQEVTFEKDIKPIVTASCALAGCHVAGAQAPVLETFDQNVENAESSLSEITKDEMPVGNPLDQAQKDLWEAWIAGGMVQGEAEDEEPAEDTESEDDDTDTTCVTDSTTENPVSNEELLNQKAVDACHEQGVIYDRNAKACGTAKIKTSYTCDRKGIT